MPIKEFIPYLQNIRRFIEIDISAWTSPTYQLVIMRPTITLFSLAVLALRVTAVALRSVPGSSTETYLTPRGDPPQSVDNSQLNTCLNPQYTNKGQVCIDVIQKSPRHGILRNVFITESTRLPSEKQVGWKWRLWTSHSGQRGKAFLLLQERSRITYS